MSEKSNKLSCWKEIAVFLSCTEKTAQRYETELGLPVHRMGGINRRRVFAFKSEIQAWMTGGEPKRLAGEGEKRLPADSDPAAIRLVAVRGGDIGRVWSVRGPAAVIGRSPGAEVCVDDPRVSRKHARILLEENGAVRLEDLGSRNGTRLNGQLPTTGQRLKSGDVIELATGLALEFAPLTQAETVDDREKGNQQAVLQNAAVMRFRASRG